MAKTEPDFHTLKTGLVVLVIVAFVLGLGVGRIATLENGKFGKVGYTLIGQSELRLREHMRSHWSNQVFLTRNYLIAVSNDSSEQTLALEHLLRHQEEFGGMLVPYYGDDASAQITKLLKEHVMGAVALIDSARSRNIEAQAEADDVWFTNSESLAQLLSELNAEHWPYSPVRNLLDNHLYYTKAMIAARLSRDYNADLASLNQAQTHALSLADALAVGIVRHHPQSFGR